GKFSQQLLQLLHFGQFCGLGKNRAFGFGFYYIRELPNPIFNYADNKLEMFSFSELRAKLIDMAANNEPGSDMTAKDLLEHPQYLRKISTKIENDEYLPTPPLIYKIRKKNGGYREIAAYCLTDKLILSIIADYFNQLMTGLITSNCYSYRKGYSSHLAAAALKKEFDKGFSWGIKLDIESFFDTLSIQKLILIFQALNIEHSIINLISSYFTKNLIQGNTISPLLSNFAMLAFDRWFRNQKKLKLIRFADDMIIIGRDINKQIVMDKINSMLKILGLKINLNKYREFSQTSSLNFLGYNISESEIFLLSKRNNDPELMDWLPYHKLANVNSKPLYLSFTITYASTTGNSIYVKSADNTTRVLWKEISRILIFGKPRISGGIIYRAIKEQIPLHFLSVHGRPLGGFQSYSRLKTIKDLFNDDDIYSFDNFSLDFSREIAFTKIINQYRLLKKRDIKAEKLTEIANSLTECDSIDSIRGKEGFAAKLYYSHFRELVADFPFESRSYHPPKGPVNVLLSLGYTLLYRRVSEALRANGIDPFSGIMHQGRGTHEALASDLVECFRFLVDRMVIALINKKLITLDNFYHNSGSSYLKLDSPGFRAFIRYYENTIKREVKINDRTFSYEVWIDKTVLSLKNSLYLGTNFKAYRSL
ncbi:MAG: CRISPR-associated endonuclease Cas1, partial [Candidatus Stygibacter frigidus]|nr:CRISPR-associated endonuclease Cas1 [Candidatus Stygibacter frigidus]